MHKDWRWWLFSVAALYDGLLGALFVLFWEDVFAFMHVTPPNHPGYVQFAALLLIIFGFMFWRVAQDPEANAGLIDYGMALKAAYSGTVFRYELTSGVPDLWVWFAWVDVAFLVAFAIARWRIVPRFSARSSG